MESNNVRNSNVVKENSITNNVKKEVKSSKEKYLGPYSKQFIDEFYKYKQYEIDILSFLLDIRRYYI